MDEFDAKEKFRRLLAEFLADPTGEKREQYLSGKECVGRRAESIWLKWNAMRECVPVSKPLGDYDHADTVENKIRI